MAKLPGNHMCMGRSLYRPSPMVPYTEDTANKCDKVHHYSLSENRTLYSQQDLHATQRKEPFSRADFYLAHQK